MMPVPEGAPLVVMVTYRQYAGKGLGVVGAKTAALLNLAAAGRVRLTTHQGKSVALPVQVDVAVTFGVVLLDADTRRTLELPGRAPAQLLQLVRATGLAPLMACVHAVAEGGA